MKGNITIGARQLWILAAWATFIYWLAIFSGATPLGAGISTTAILELSLFAVLIGETYF